MVTCSTLDGSQEPYLSEKKASQVQGVEYCVILFAQYFQTDKRQWERNRSVVAKGYCWGNCVTIKEEHEEINLQWWTISVSWLWWQLFESKAENFIELPLPQKNPTVYNSIIHKKVETTHMSNNWWMDT